MSEGLLEGEIENDQDPDKQLFGRSLYCNYPKSYYIGYTSRLQKNMKGIYSQQRKGRETI